VSDVTVDVNDIYRCIQGEGVLAGTPMVMVRLQGCSVGCPWCDTRETWRLDGDHHVALRDAIAQRGTPRWSTVDVCELAGYVADVACGIDWALISGGEPGEQSGLASLCEALHDTGMRVACETSGTGEHVVTADIDHLTVSPKVDMPGGRDVRSDVVAAADEIKWVVGRERDIDRLELFLGRFWVRDECVIALQPLSQSRRATELCIRTCMERGWRLSVQTHKYLGLA